MERIVSSLEGHPHHLHTYLDAVFQRDSQLGAPFHDRQIELYAQYAPSKLLDFLKASVTYDVAKAYAVCEKNELIPEMVYLLGRLGNNRKALMLIIKRLGDVSRVCP
jgi:hypothetical protein